MSNQIDNTVRKTHRSAVISLITGLLSLLLYPVAFNVFFASTIFSLIIAGSGIILCVISLNASSKAIEQIKKGGNVEKGHGIAIAGRILGFLSVLGCVVYLGSIAVIASLQ